MRSLAYASLVVLALLGAASAQTSCSTDGQCADGNVCNGTERCLGGFCQPGTPPTCNDGNVCTLDQCDPLGGCQHAPVVNNTSCSDGNPCNGMETCRAGACTAGSVPPDGTSCNTGNACTNADFCRDGTCVPGIVRPDGAGCGDGNECNGNETCQQGICTPGVPKANGTTCGDGNPCDGVDTCQNGACVIGAVPPDGTPCGDASVCNGAERCLGGQCVAGTPAPDGEPCPDDSLCNGNETCKDGICRAGTPPDCEDNNPCTNDSCGNLVGCKHVARPVGAFCDDGVACNGREVCNESAVCVPGPQAPDGTDCDDGNICNGLSTCSAGQCIPGTPLPDDFPCADNNLCNGVEHCQAGACKPGTPLVCVDNNPCTTDGCQPDRGCRFDLLPDGTECGDSNVCNGSQTCQGGGCITGAPLVCDPGDVCDPFAGCTDDAPIAGDRLRLRAHPSGQLDASARTKGQISLSAPLGPGSAADPVQHGGVLRIRSVANGIDKRWALPASGWKYLGEPSLRRGYRFTARARGDGVRSLVVKDGKVTKVLASAGDLDTPLGADPDPVEVVVILGNVRYCMAFGGKTSFEPDQRFIAIDALAPADCPP